MMNNRMIKVVYVCGVEIVCKEIARSYYHIICDHQLIRSTVNKHDALTAFNIAVSVLAIAARDYRAGGVSHFVDICEFERSG